MPDDAQTRRLSTTTAWIGVLLTACTIFGFVLASLFVRHATSIGPVPSDSFDARVFDFRMNVILFGIFASVWTLVTPSGFAADFFRLRWRTAYTVAALIAASGFLSAFIIYFGNRQFGSWDFGILIDSGWRQVLGQRPYTDFISPNPPGFNLGIKYAFELFGVNWNAQLYFTAIFASASFLWSYWLLLKLTGSRIASFGMAFAIQCAVDLPLCFWWYNNSVSIMAALFFLSCLLYAEQPNSPKAQASYFFSLVLLALMKPNIAGLVGIGGILFLLISVGRKRRLVLLTLAAAAATFLVMQVNGLSISAMMASYRAIAVEHAGYDKYGLVGMKRVDKIKLFIWTLAVAAPLFGLIRPIWNKLRNKLWREAAFYLFFWLALLITFYGMVSNGEIKEAECGTLLAAGAVVAFGLRIPGSYLRRFYIAMVFAIAVSGIYMGASRIRVLGIGPHQFFEWRNGNSPVGVKFFKDTHASPLMGKIIQQIKAAKSANQGPFFIGPRIEFAYAVVGIPSPRHLPVYWMPGTSFARADEPRLIALWRRQDFKTLIFLKGDYTFYSPSFVAVIKRDYQQDDSYPDITVYRARQ